MIDFQQIFTIPIQLNGNLITLKNKSEFENQQQTNDAFSEKWLKLDVDKGTKKLDEFQRKWYLDLYGFKNEDELKNFL